MSKVFICQSGCVVEKATMKKPSGFDNRIDRGMCEPYVAYQNHLDNLKTYPAEWSTEEGKEVILDKDFRLQYQEKEYHSGKWKECTHGEYAQLSDLYRRIVAVAIPAEKEGGGDEVISKKQFQGMRKDMDMALEREKMYEKALRNLCHLKKWKDEHGKDHHYEQFQPEAWSYAFSIIEMFSVDNSPYSSTPITEATDLKRLYYWLMDENRKPAQTFFTESWLRNVAKEIEYRLYSPTTEPVEEKEDELWKDVCKIISTINSELASMMAKSEWSAIDERIKELYVELKSKFHITRK